MAVCRSVINTALRKLGVLAAGRDARPQDLADGLTALQGLYTAWIAGGAFGRLDDYVPTGTTYTPHGNARIFRQQDAPVTVELPVLVSNEWLYDYGWYRVCGNYRPNVTPRDGMAVVISDEVGGQTASWLYDGNVKRWQQIELLDEDDDAPRSSADPLGLASCLAIELSDQYNGDVAEQTVVAAGRYKAAMTQRFGMRREDNYNPGSYV